MADKDASGPSPRPGWSITPVRRASDLKDAIGLFCVYAKSLGVDLAFQNFDAEMAAMPGKYAPPDGELLLARDAAGTAVGCVALRPLPSADDDARVCEMKRLYVDPAGRGMGLGKKLASSIVTVAETLGYSELRLDTLPRMVSARALYHDMGFEGIPPYYDTPLEGTHFLALKLPRPPRARCDHES